MQTTSEVSTKRKNAKIHQLLLTLIPTIAISLIVGTGGALVFEKYFKDDFIAAGWIDQDDGVIVREVQPVTVTENDAVVDAVKKVNPAVVSIISEQTSVNVFNQSLENVASGSGFIVTADGIIATNKHVVEGAKSVKVLTQAGKEYEAKILDIDPLNDFAVLKIDANDLPVVDLGYSDQVKVGERVIAIGNALGAYDHTVTTGIVSGTNRNIVAGGNGASDRLEGLLQVDAAINQGNSGGPLTNIGGQVIGINTAVDRQGEGIGFAIPVNDIRSAIESAIKDGRIIRPLLGVRYINVTPDFAAVNNLKVENGALLATGSDVASAIVPGGPADKAGLKSGDIITAISDDKIDQESSLVRLLQKYKPGDKVTVHYNRDGDDKTTEATLGEAS